MWHDLLGEPGYLSGSAGTATVPAGAVVLIISAHASSNGAQFTLFGGAAVPVINGAAPVFFYFYHTLYKADTAGSNAIVFTSTDHYFVHYVKQGHV